MSGVIRLGVGALFATQVAISLWQAVWPEHFYSAFPTVSLTPPYSEHFLRDVGFAGLALAVLLGSAVLWPTRKLTAIALTCYLVWAVPHLAFHASHLHDATAADLVFLAVSLGGSVLGPSALLVATLARRNRRVDAAPPE